MNIKALRSFVALGLVLSAITQAMAVEWRRITPSIVWEKWEWGGSDWIMEYKIPAGFRYDSLSPIGYRSYILTTVTVGRGGLSTSPYYVTLTAGYRARWIASNYYGARYNNVYEWANETGVWVYKP